MALLLAGATGTIGRAVAHDLVAAGHEVLCPVRSGAVPPQGVTVLRCDLARPGGLSRALNNRRVDAVISCMASRGGAPADAWAVEHDAQLALLTEAAQAGARHFVLVSAICVQKPRLAFQHAKLAFEAELRHSGLTWSIVRPTAFFKSLSGQVARVQAGKPYLVFGDGRRTACKPISGRDLARYVIGCLDRHDRHNRVLPIGGPGPAITPRDQATRLFEMLGRPLRIRHVPPALMGAIAGGAGLLSGVAPRMRAKAELARIGHYYATESMLVWDAATGRYDADATPETGNDTLWAHYADILAGRSDAGLGAHAVF